MCSEIKEAENKMCSKGIHLERALNMLDKGFFYVIVVMILVNGDHGSFQSKTKELIERV